jgi:hypothetical protein
MASDDYEDKYTDPDLRRRIKDELMQSDKGGTPGQWSARKSQMLAREYEAQGGGYIGEKDERARSLDEWTEQDWQTAQGDDRAREGNTTKRYLPKKVWDMLSDEEKREAERVKETASRKGEQHVEWTPAVKRAMEMLEQDGNGKSGNSKQDLLAQAKQLEIKGRSKMNKQELQQAIADAKR